MRIPCDSIPKTAYPVSVSLACLSAFRVSIIILPNELFEATIAESVLYDDDMSVWDEVHSRFIVTL